MLWWHVSGDSTVIAGGISGTTHSTGCSAMQHIQGKLLLYQVECHKQHLALVVQYYCKRANDTTNLIKTDFILYQIIWYKLVVDFRY